MLMPKYKPLINAMMFVIIAYGLYFILRYFDIGVIKQFTPSMPEGYYLTYYTQNITRDDDVLFKPNEHIQQFIVDHGWLPKGVPLLKRIVGIPGDKLCIKQRKVAINNKTIAIIKHKDSQGNPLPVFQFCGVIARNQYFVQGIANDHSFDSRYYGLISSNQIISKAIKL